MLPIQANIPYPGIRRNQICNDIQAVIQDNELAVWIILLQKILDRSRHKGASVSRGHKTRDKWSVCNRGCRSKRPGIYRIMGELRTFCLRVDAPFLRVADFILRALAHDHHTSSMMDHMITTCSQKLMDECLDARIVVSIIVKDDISRRHNPGLNVMKVSRD